MKKDSMHDAQIAILYKLRHNEQSRYSDLMRSANLESDIFKFHIHSLVNAGYISKLESGQYSLTIAGSEFANNLDKSKKQTLKQSKLSVLIFATTIGDDGNVRYLMQKRLRKPFYEYWSFITGPVHWGETFESACARELKKQTGLTAEFKFGIVQRKRDFEIMTEKVIEDKTFIVMYALNIGGIVSNNWPGGENAWMSAEELISKKRTFESDLELLNAVDNSSLYLYSDSRYDFDSY